MWPVELIAERARDIILLIGADGRILDGNLAAVRAYGYPHDELIALNIRDLRAEETQPDVPRQMREAGARGILFETVHRRKSGETFPCEVSSQGAELRGEDVLVSIIRDITERKRAAEAVRRSEERFRSLIEASADGILVHRDDQIIYVNPAVLTLLGYADAGELCGKSPLVVVHPDDRAAVLERLARLGAGEASVPPMEQRLQRKDGSTLMAEVVGMHCEFDGAPALMAIGRDITERRRLEEQLRQAQKMEAVGRLAGGVAHDFNNILTAIQGQCELLLQLLDAQAPARRHGELILRAAGRAASLTGQLLAFSRKQVLQPRVIDLNHSIAELKIMLSTLIGESIEFVTELDPSLPRVKADPNQLEQVIVNLLVNARDAMPDGGRLTVRTINEGGQAQLEVRDTGVGIDAETLPRIFEPFFTTKKPRKGTGLGLSMAYGIVTQSGGTITVESAPGQGALFRVTLPSAEGAVEPTQAAVPGPAPRGHETVLLVEDDGDVRQFLLEVLESHGYRVLAARDGVEAVRLAEREPRGAELLLTDVVMPRMSGPEVAERLKPLWPAMKVLFISGYAEQSLGAAGAALLKKPFTVVELARRVRAVLDAAT